MLARRGFDFVLGYVRASRPKNGRSSEVNVTHRAIPVGNGVGVGCVGHGVGLGLAGFGWTRLVCSWAFTEKTNPRVITKIAQKSVHTKYPFKSTRRLEPAYNHGFRG